MKNTQYINIQGWMINELKLKGNDLLVFAIIYGFSQDGESKFNGSLTYLKEATNSSRATMMRTLKTLESKMMITKVNVETKHMQTNTYTAETELVSKLTEGGIKMTPPTGIKMTPNNTTTNTIEDRMANFSLELKPYLSKYGKEMLNQFYSYWTEPSKNKKKLRFEGERYFDISRRLATWSSRNNKGNNNSDSGTEFDPNNYKS